MLKYFSVENFKSIKNKVVLEFDTGLKANSPYVAQPIVGIAGANASGKTALLQAITFTLWFMQDSFLRLAEDQDLPFEPFCTQQDKPTRLHMIFAHNFLLDGEEKLIDFEYSAELSGQEVFSEELEYYPHEKNELVYSRKQDSIKFGETINKLDREILVNLRKNCSLVSFAAQFPAQAVAVSCQHYEYISNVGYKGLQEVRVDENFLLEFLDDPDLKLRSKEFLSAADLGIIEIYEVQIGREDSVIFEYLKRKADEFESLSESQKELVPQDERELLETIINASNLRDLKIEFSQSGLRHNIDNIIINFEIGQESSGTLQFILTLYWIMQVFKSGGILILDEMELKLHQNLVAYLIGLFQNEEQNPKGAQLLFSFHNTYLMEILSPEQLWFTEKNDRGQTDVFSAAHFEDIVDLHKKNLEHLYRIGRFGAKPRGL